MTRHFSILLSLGLLALLCAAPRPVQAAASYDTCKGFITSLPAVIDTAGTWCFNKDLNTAASSGNAIQITSDNVTIDCNGFKLGGLAAGEGTLENGITATDQRNITIRHCNIRGFSTGISVYGSSLANGGHLIEDNRFDGNTNYGILLSGDGSIVRRNQINGTGFITLSGGGEAVRADGWVDLIDNTVAGVTATASYSARGIETESDNGSVVGNRVSGLAAAGGTYNMVAIFAGSSHATVRDNNVIGTGDGQGIYCSDSNGVAKDNVISGMAIALTNCSDGGGNDSSP